MYLSLLNKIGFRAEIFYQIKQFTSSWQKFNSRECYNNSKFEYIKWYSINLHKAKIDTTPKKKMEKFHNQNKWDIIKAFIAITVYIFQRFKN